MNLIQTVANRIESRIEALILSGDLPKKGKRTDTAALECWIGATIGAVAIHGDDNHPDVQWLLRVATLLISVRGYAEVRNIARKGREDDRFAEVEAEKEADINRAFNLG